MDYKQELITTIHDFGCDIDLLEHRIVQLSQQSPTAILIPALYEELQRPALAQIRDHLARCGAFIKSVVVCLYAETVEQYAHAVDFFEPLPQEVFIIWENGPRVTQLLEDLNLSGLNLLNFRGKGRAVWLGLGLATLQAEAIAIHDADITTYDRSYPITLLLPLLEKELGLAFNKAYYARLGSHPRSLYGRVVRLFVTPLLSTLTDLFGTQRYLSYLSAYRYPLSGEFALNSDLALNIRIPSNWGLEIGFLAEVYRNIARKRISQVDLGVFEHKHQQLGTSVDEGLQKMCRDIFRSMLRTLTEMEQVVVTMEHIHALRVKFRRRAQDYTHQYFVDAYFNQLQYDRHREEIAVELFETVILEAGHQYFLDPAGVQIPAWTRALTVRPDLREQLRHVANQDAVEAKQWLRSEPLAFPSETYGPSPDTSPAA